MKPVGLTPCSTEDLKKLLAAVYKETVSCPLTVPELTRVGLQESAADLLHHLRELDQRAVQAVLVAVIAERLSE